MNKKLTAGIVSGVVLAAAIGCIFESKEEQQATVSYTQKQEEKIPQTTEKQNIKPKQIKQKADLYSSTVYDLPLISIVEISKASQPAKKAIDSTLEASQGFYLLKRNNNGKIIAILQNPVQTSNTFNRHDLQFAEISDDGNIIYHTAGYPGIEGETANAVDEKEDKWVFDRSEEPFKPLKHTAFDENGKIKFTEEWNYDSDEPVKYEMKDAQGKVVSILKETFTGDSYYTKDHIFYDNDGNTVMHISASYDGANISKFTYYNTEDKDNNITIMSEYSDDGLKFKEKIYDQNYTLTNTVTTDYDENGRKSVAVWNPEGQKIEDISS